MRLRSLAGLAAALVVSTFLGTADAQQPYGGYPQQPYGGYPQQQPYGGYPQQQPYGGGGYGYPQQPYGGGYGYPQQPVSTGRPRSTGLEIGYLYATATAYGVGTGIWVDALFGIENPGLALIAPGILGVAAPVLVFIADRPRMPEGLPSAIATGMLIGAAEGLGVASYQWMSADKKNEWPFLGLATSEFIGGTVGGVAGFAFYHLLRPNPKTNMLLASSAVWGSAIGGMFGGGASRGDWGQANDSVALGGLIGLNVAVAGAVGVSLAWTPSWNQIGWMWGGAAIGAVASLPVYIAYAGSDSDPRTGLIFQGVASLLGLGAGAFIGRPDRAGALVRNDEELVPERPFLKVLGAGPLSVPGGMGAQLMGELW
ncbi:hypothetical protein [Chondromyces crocatus]|uniref:Integral membrane protein n=1 Tax=Chondromyces crocatus TaxID=52 RepID=A0A0K1ES08_CHOCO|nr:hypothetical protein [Chondromyces crocatus]AKT43408.1 uncharacterized protein CMC5_076400 [Chondromyces crocatus]